MIPHKTLHTPMDFETFKPGSNLKLLSWLTYVFIHFSDATMLWSLIPRDSA